MNDLISMSISVSFWMYAAKSNAIMDTLSHHFRTSIFEGRNDQYWNPEISWKNKYVDGNVLKGRVKWNILGYEFNKHPSFLDGWHFHKSLMMVCICGAIATYKSVGWQWDIISFLLYGTIWNSVFSYYYDKKLLK